MHNLHQVYADPIRFKAINANLHKFILRKMPCKYSQQDENVSLV